ncbi:MAG TPA: metal-binding protein [Verrucomicrobiae bacterium]
MNLKFSYLGHSTLRSTAGGQLLSLSPNLAREAVSFDAPLLQPLRFREAISALHDVVISDLRFKPRDKTAYEEWKKNERSRVASLRQQSYQEAKKEILSKRDEAVPPDLEKRFAQCRQVYWDARQKYSSYLLKNDPQLWRMLMPCDPVITVAEDVVFFECFSADESNYGCLTVNRDSAFGKSAETRLGTTNVDYSWDLFHHFQSLRSYRETRFKVDPAGFTVATAGNADYREEKIDLPDGWLRGFMQTQAAMTLPSRRVTLTREAVYSVLAFLKRHKARKSPRALRFEMVAGKPPSLVLEPWEERVPVYGEPLRMSSESIRIWGRQRLLALARVLPLAEKFDVYLLGTGLPSFWVADMGDMKLTLGLSGWTTNDWTRGSALDLLAPPVQPARDFVASVAQFMRDKRAAAFADIDLLSGGQPAQTAAALNHLAHTGQLIHDLPNGVYRWRQIMPMALGEAELGPENPELAASKEILWRKRAKLDLRTPAAGGFLVTGVADHKPVELFLNADGLIKRGKCPCSHHYKYGIRAGPCRHLLALRTLAMRETESGVENSLAGWYQQLRNFTAN